MFTTTAVLSVLTLQQWGDMIIESNKGDSNE